jgi:hypothetical protein
MFCMLDKYLMVHLAAESWLSQQQLNACVGAAGILSHSCGIAGTISHST